MGEGPIIVWLRHDLRLADNPALQAAVATRRPIIPLYVWGPDEDGKWPPGSASKWWLHQSLRSLQGSLADRGSRLTIRQGRALPTLRQLIEETSATTVYWNRRYEPAIVVRDTAVKNGLKSNGMEVESFNASLLLEPWSVQTRAGKPFQVFTPFWNACLQLPGPPPPRPAPKSLPMASHWPFSLKLEELQLEPRIDWAKGIRAAWQPGEGGAQLQLGRWIKNGLERYAAERDRPDLPGTSRLSPHLHFGEIGPGQVWHAVRDAMDGMGKAGSQQAVEAFLREVGWREFAYHLLYHFPSTPDESFREDFSRFPWRDDRPALARWRRGQTGYPIVDAGMRELWATGWMHNRVRMITASFLVKHLLMRWHEGARWFWDTLVDADLANNTLGWQWTAGCGADAAPYFRIFNPVLQGEKFDPAGAYVRRWVPELKGLSDSLIHKPWEASRATLAEAGIQLSVTYPEPMVDHSFARKRALDRFREMR